YNGTLATTQLAGPANFNIGDAINIGMENLTTAGDFDLFKGEVDELSVYNRALSDQEIAAIFGAGSAGKCKPGAPVVDAGSPPSGGGGGSPRHKDDDDGEHEDDDHGHHWGKQRNRDRGGHHGLWREPEDE